jgi:hypothetical protein
VNTIDSREKLHDTILFRGFTEREMDEFLPLLDALSAKAGEIVVRQDELADFAAFRDDFHTVRENYPTISLNISALSRNNAGFRDNLHALRPDFPAFRSDFTIAWHDFRRVSLNIHACSDDLHTFRDNLHAFREDFHWVGETDSRRPFADAGVADFTVQSTTFPCARLPGAAPRDS